MLKILSTSKTNNESFMCKEMGISSSLYDDLSTIKPQEIIDKIGLTFKGEKKIDKMVYDKLIFILSLIISSKQFDSNGKTKTLLKNILESIKQLKDIPMISGFEDLLSLIPSTYDNLKEYLFTTIYAYNIERVQEKVIQLFYESYSHGMTSDMCVEDFFNYINTIHSYDLLTKITIPKLLLTHLKKMTSINPLRGLFYIIFSSENLYHDQAKALRDILAKKEAEFKNELELMSLVEKQQYSDLIKYSQSCPLSAVYGEEATECIILSAKLSIVYMILSKVSKDKKEVSFKELESLTNASFESFEDVLIEGNIQSLFKTQIVYDTQSLNLYYVKKVTYSKEDIQKLEDEIASLRIKFTLIQKSIASI